MKEQKNKNETSTKYAILIGIIIACFFGAKFIYGKLFAKNSEAKKELVTKSINPKGKIHEYKILQEKNISTNLRSRKEWYILSKNANTYEDRALTVIAASKKLQKQSGAKFVRIWLYQNPSSVGTSYHVAKADYCPDGKCLTGNENGKFWQVEAYKNKLSGEEIKYLEIWNKAKHEVQIGRAHV